MKMRRDVSGSFLSRLKWYEGVLVLSLREERRFSIIVMVGMEGSDLHEIWVEDVELVSLHDLGRRIVGAVHTLIISFYPRRTGRSPLTHNASDCTCSTQTQYALY